jgi:murein DD-endopeptidase MepM/ murein hydrolase activator NlpD
MNACTSRAPKASSYTPMRDATHPVLKGEATLFAAWGYRVDAFNRDKISFHEGIDLRQTYDAPVYSPADASVTFAGVKGTYGRVVEIKLADGYSLRFGHLNTLSVAANEKVKAGQKIGSMGSTGRSTGPHLHLEVLRDGKLYNPQDIPGLTFADKLRVDAPPALTPPLSAPAEPPASPQPAPSVTPIVFPQEATPRAARPQSGGKDLPAPMYSPMKMRVVSVEPDASGMTVALDSLVTEGVNKGCKFRTTAMTDVKVRTGEAIEQGDLVGTRNKNSDQYVNCGMMFAQLMLSQGDPSWAATQQAIEASKKAVEASQKAVGAAKIPATPVTPAAPAAPSTPASPTSYTPQPDAEFWQQLHRGVSVDTNLVRTRYRQGARPEIRAPFGARVIQAKQVSDKTGVVVLQQVGPGQGYPLTASSRRCDMSIVLSLVRVSVGQTLAEGDLVGEAQLGNTGRAWSCDGVTIADGPAELPPKLEGATHAIVASPARLTSGFGIRLDPFDSGNSALHPGMDIGKDLGAAIYAPVGATVWRAENDPDLGNVVVLGVDGGYTFRFARLQEIKVKRGDTVKAGDILGTMGSTGPSTGPHLHFEAFWNGRAYNPAVVPGLTLIGPS